MSDVRVTVLPALLAAGLVAAVLAVLPGLPHPFETPKDAVVCLTVGAGLALAALGPAPRLPAALAAPLVAFLASGVIASAAAGLWTHALVMDGIGVLLLVLGVTALATPSARASVAHILVVIAAVESVIAAVQLALGPAAIHLLGSAPRRAYAFGTLGVPNWVGALVAMALPGALLVPSRRFVDAVLVALLALGLLVSGSRGVWLAALGTLGLVGTRGKGRPLVVGALAGGVLIAATGGLEGHGPGSLSGRLLIWRATAEMIAAHPFLGVAPGGFAGAYPGALHAVVGAQTHGFPGTAFVAHPHDLLLAVTAERGIVGLLAFLWMVVVLVRLGRRRAPTDRTRTAAGGALTAFAVYGLVDYPLASTPLAMAAWLSAAALVAPDGLPEAGARSAPARLALAGAGVAAAAYGFAALIGDSRLAFAWAAAAHPDPARAAAVAETVRLGPGRDEAYQVRGLAALGAGEPSATLSLLGIAARSRADPDLYLAAAAARARGGDVQGAVDGLDWLAETLPGLVGPHIFAAELRRAAGAGGVEEALARALANARETAPNPRLDVFVTLAAARRRERQVAEEGTPLVVVDAGHGGSAMGAQSEGLIEKDLALQLAKPLTAALRRRGVRVVLTRTRDRAVPLDMRSRLANARGADLFVSLHANAARDPAGRGIELYVRAVDLDQEVFPNLSVRDRALLVNAVPDGFGRAVAARRTLDRCALDAAGQIVTHLPSTEGITPAIRSSNLYLLRQVQAPAVLVEVGYLTNRDDSRRLRRASYRRALVAGLAEGALGALGTPCRP